MDRRAQGEHLDDGTGLGADRQQAYVAPVGQLAEGVVGGHAPIFDHHPDWVRASIARTTAAMSS